MMTMMMMVMLGECRDVDVRLYDRVISRAPGLKLVVQTLLSSLRPIGNIVLICCTFFIIFGILGLQVLASIAAADP